MRSTQTCPKCTGKKFAITENIRLPDREYDTYTSVVPAVTLATGANVAPRVGGIQGGGRALFGRLSSWICVACGYTEFYTHAYSVEGFEQLARQFPSEFRIVDGEPQGQGPFR